MNKMEQRGSVTTMMKRKDQKDVELIVTMYMFFNGGVHTLNRRAFNVVTSLLSVLMLLSIPSLLLVTIGES